MYEYCYFDFSWTTGVHDQKDPMVHIKDKQIPEDIYPIQTEYLIIGGGIMGAAVAYWLGQFHIGCPITVIERDPSYTQVLPIFPMIDALKKKETPNILLLLC